MTDRQIFLDRADALRLSRSITKTNRLSNNSRFSQSSGQLQINEGLILVETPEGGIGPKSGTNFIGGECIIYTIDPATGQYQKFDNGTGTDQTTTVYNPTSALIPGNQIIFAAKSRSGLFFAQSPPTQLNGLIRVTFDEDFGTATGSVNCTVAKSEFDQYENGAGITADNSIGLESDKGNRGFVYVYADGTLEIVNAECPADS